MKRGTGHWVEAIPDASMRRAAEEIFLAEAAAYAEWKSFVDPRPRRMSAADSKRAAYLHGMLAGLHRAAREFEKRRPLQFVGSSLSPAETE